MPFFLGFDYCNILQPFWAAFLPELSVFRLNFLSSFVFCFGRLCKDQVHAGIWGIQRLGCCDHQPELWPELQGYSSIPEITFDKSYIHVHQPGWGVWRWVNAGWEGSNLGNLPLSCLLVRDLSIFETPPPWWKCSCVSISCQMSLSTVLLKHIILLAFFSVKLQV